MPHTNGLLPTLTRDDNGGYVAAGAFDWDDCLYVSVCLVQGLVAATVQGVPGKRDFTPEERTEFGIATESRRWELTTPFTVLAGGALQQGHADATAVAMMTIGSGSGAVPRAYFWQEPKGVILA